MTHSLRCKRLDSLCLALVAWLGVPSSRVDAAQTGMPSALVGTWDVVRVSVHKSDQPRWRFQPDDPALLGRELVIGTDAVTSTIDESLACKPALVRQHRSNWAHLLAAGFTGGDSINTPADYGLKVSRKATVSAFTLCWKAGDDGWEEDGFWVVPRSSTELVLHYASDALLILTRRATDAKPTPSFSCSRATSPTEKAICSSFELASLDRSVAMVWGRIKRSGNVTPQLVAKQKAWLRTRDACGSAPACLKKVMEERIADGFD